MPNISFIRNRNYLMGALKTTSQLIGFALSNSLGIIIGSFVVGFLIEYFKIDKAILTMMFIAVLGILVTIFYDRKIKDKTI